MILYVHFVGSNTHIAMSLDKEQLFTCKCVLIGYPGLILYAWRTRKTSSVSADSLPFLIKFSCLLDQKLVEGDHPMLRWLRGDRPE